MYVFFNNVFFLKIYNLFTKAYEGPQQPTTANEGQRRPAAAHGRPTQAHEGSQHPTTIGMFFLIMYCFLNLQLIHEGPQKPTKADAGPQRGTNGPNDARRVIWAGIGKSFLMYFFLMYNLSMKAHEGPTKADAGPQREKTV